MIVVLKHSYDSWASRNVCIYLHINTVWMKSTYVCDEMIWIFKPFQWWNVTQASVRSLPSNNAIQMENIIWRIEHVMVFQTVLTRVIHGVIGFFWRMAQKMRNWILIQEKVVIFDIGHVIAWGKSKIWHFLTMFLGFRLYKLSWSLLESGTYI